MLFTHQNAAMRVALLVKPSGISKQGLKNTFLDMLRITLRKPMRIATTNEMKRSAIAEHLIKNPICGKNYNESSFSILKKCINCFYMIKLDEAILIKLYKP